MILKKAFDEFQRSHVSLNQSRLKRIQSAHWSVRGKLQKNDWVSSYFVDTKLQGSYALGTATCCPHSLRPYDVDVILGMKLNDEGGTLPSDQRQYMLGPATIKIG